MSAIFDEAPLKSSSALFLYEAIDRGTSGTLQDAKALRWRRAHCVLYKDHLPRHLNDSKNIPGGKGATIALFSVASLSFVYTPASQLNICHRG